MMDTGTSVAAQNPAYRPAIFICTSNHHNTTAMKQRSLLSAKRTLLSFLTIILLPVSAPLQAAPQIERVEPLCWWTDMQCPLTLMCYGEDLQDAQVCIQRLQNGKPLKGQCNGLVVTGQHNAESPNYLFIDVRANEAGTYRITLQKGKRRTHYDYTILSRRPDSRERQSFSAADVIYLIMSDRFVDGDSTNNTSPLMAEAGNRNNVHGRYGGDIQGIMQTLDHISALGATAIWPTPLLCDNEPAWSYHGYACSDYYHIDPRYGTNELYCDLVRQAHSKGIKVLMDMVPNHCGTAHWWMQDLPYSDWINQWDTYTTTNNVFSSNYDTHASQFDRTIANGGWFDHAMPDMNLRNPDLLQYFKQWAIWWIEYAGLDGLRVDTYPYLEPVPASQWIRAIRNEYPNINIVGECWTRPASAVAYWQDGADNYNGFNSHLPAVMDFPLNEAIRQALADDGTSWGGGMMKVYDALAMDYLYANIDQLLIFLGNHDMDRFADVVKDNDIRRVKIGLTLLATLRGIPQLFAGDEYAMRSSDLSLGHSTLRMPLPKDSELTDIQRELFDYQCRLFQYRKSEPILHSGKLMHFATRDNTYAYFRYTDEGAVFVYVNASEEPHVIPTMHYAEILNHYNAQGTDILTGDLVDLHKTDITVEPLSALIVKLGTLMAQ